MCSEPLFQTGVSVKNQNVMANSADPERQLIMSRLVMQDLDCLQKKKIFWSSGLKGLLHVLSVYYLAPSLKNNGDHKSLIINQQ